MECRRPGRPICPGKLTESCFAVHDASVGTSFWKRNHSLPGVLCRVQYSRGWSARICIPDRMMKIIRNMLKKCCTPTQPGMPGFASASADMMVPGYRAMNCSTAGIVRRACPTATAQIRTTKPIGSSQRRLNHRFRPIRKCGAVPNASGNHFATSTTSSPTVSCFRKLRMASGEGGDGAGDEDGLGRSDIDLNSLSAAHAQIFHWHRRPPKVQLSFCAKQIFHPKPGREFAEGAGSPVANRAEGKRVRWRGPQVQNRAFAEGRSRLGRS